MENCIFCKIAEGDIPTDFLYESEHVLAFRDIQPIAPVHVLIIPKKHIASVNDVEQGDQNVMGELFVAARTVAKKLQITEDGYKLLIRTGVHGGQEVPHIHMHVIGGAQLTENIHPI